MTSTYRRSLVICGLVMALTPVMLLAAVETRPTTDPLQLVRIATIGAFFGMGWVVWLRLRARSTKRVLILGAGSTASMLIEEIEWQPARYQVVGVVDRAVPTNRGLSSRWLGCFDELAAIVDRVRPTHIVLATDNRRADLPYKALLHSRVHGVLVEDALDFQERLTGTVPIEALTPGRLLLSDGFSRGGTAEVWGRAISLVAAAIGLVLVAPLLAIVAVAIKLDSRGPVLFVQQRAGREGRPFPLLKFRTMRPCDQHRSEWARDNEDRITSLGKLLRRYRVDELPQLVNVLRGEMNLIGPRPHPVCNIPLFEERIAFYTLRLAVLPGITGWAQVRHGYANTLDEETEKMRYDLYYIKNRSPWLDCRIACETIATLVGGRLQRPAGSRRLASSSKAKTGPLPVVTWTGAGTPSIGRP